jgi:hypothetical protein
MRARLNAQDVAAIEMEQCRLIDAYLAWYRADRRVTLQRARARRNTAAYRDRQKTVLSGRWQVSTRAAAKLRRSA